MSPDTRLSEGLAGLRLNLPTKTRSQLLQYLTLLSKWNRIYNLTAIRQPSRLVSHHLLDSLAVLTYLEGSSIVDVGSGAGLPGIPLAIAQPHRRVVLLDSNHKKGAFLRQAVLELGLDNTEVVTTRVEQWSPASLFDVVISRAFSDLLGFVEAARHLCKATGVLAAMKGVYPDEELAQVGSSIRVLNVVPLSVPGLQAARHLVLLQPRQS